MANGSLKTKPCQFEAHAVSLQIRFSFGVLPLEFQSIILREIRSGSQPRRTLGSGWTHYRTLSIDNGPILARPDSGV